MIEGLEAGWIIDVLFWEGVRVSDGADVEGAFSCIVGAVVESANVGVGMFVDAFSRNAEVSPDVGPCKVLRMLGLVVEEVLAEGFHEATSAYRLSISFVVRSALPLKREESLRMDWRSSGT